MDLLRVYNKTRYLVLFGGEKYDSTYNRIRYLMGVKNGITCYFSYNAKIKVDSPYVIIVSCTSFRVNLHSRVCLNVKELLA